jgi:glycogen phosphorylase
VETTLARSLYNCDEHAAYAATSLAFRDRLILDWNRTQQRQTYRDSKRVYYLSLEFLMGRALDNAMLNVGLKDTAKCECCSSDLMAPCTMWLTRWIQLASPS